MAQILKKVSFFEKGPGRFRTAKKGLDASGLDAKKRFAVAKNRFSDANPDVQGFEENKKGAGTQKTYLVLLFTFRIFW